MDGEKLWQYTILGDLLEFDLHTKKIRLIKGTEKYKEIPSVFTIYKMNNAFYHIENYVNAIMDEEGNPVITLKESENKISFFYCSQEHNNLIYLLEGNGRFYKKIDITEKTYEYEKITEPIIYAFLLPDEIIWITSNGNVVSHSYVNDNTKTVLKSELMLDIIAAASDMKETYYFLSKQGNIFGYDHDSGKMIWQFDLQEKGDAYSQIHLRMCIDDRGGTFTIVSNEERIENYIDQSVTGNNNQYMGTAKNIVAGNGMVNDIGNKNKDSVMPNVQGNMGKVLTEREWAMLELFLFDRQLKVIDVENKENLKSVSAA